MTNMRKIPLYLGLLLAGASLAFAQFLGPVGSWTTPMQQTLRAAPTAGSTFVGPRGAPGGIPGVPPSGMTARDRSNLMVTESQWFANSPALTSRDAARISMYRGVTRGIRF